VSLVELLMLMQADMPRVIRERRKKQAHHKLGLNRIHNADTSWMPAQWIAPSYGTNVSHRARLWDEPEDQ
jgi:hypothetical protein